MIGRKSILDALDDLETQAIEQLKKELTHGKTEHSDFFAGRVQGIREAIDVVARMREPSGPVPQPYTTPKPLPYKETLKYSAAGKRALARLGKSVRANAEKALKKMDGAKP